MAIKFTTWVSEWANVWNKPAFTTCNKRYDKSFQFHGLSGKAFQHRHKHTHCMCYNIILRFEIYRCFILESTAPVSVRVWVYAFKISTWKCNRRFITIINLCVRVCVRSLGILCCENLFISSRKMIVGTFRLLSPCNQSTSFPSVSFFDGAKGESGAISFHDFLFHLISHILEYVCVCYWNRKCRLVSSEVSVGFFALWTKVAR